MNLNWIDDFVNQIRPRIFVRQQDSLLILVPNKSFKLNPTALDLLARMLDGNRLHDLLPGIEQDHERSRQVGEFFLDLRSLIQGCFNESQKRSGVEVKPFSLPHNTLPVLSEIALTYRCNLDCVFCYAGCSCHKRSADSDKQMTTEEIKLILEKIRYQAHVPSVSFTGGEPARRSDLEQLIRYAKNLGLWVNLITNGTLITPARAQKLAEAGLNSAQVSLEGTTAETHEKITNKAHSFTDTVHAVHQLFNWLADRSL